MPSTPVQLAKLTRPRLHSALARESLFQKLLDSTDKPVVWVCAPPGSGKTTLISTFIERNALPHLWYQLDDGDADLANFFYYFRIGASALIPDAAQLPLFTPEYAADPQGFARRIFREFFHLAPVGCQVVLDNFHEVSADSALHGAMACAAEEVPAGARLVLISRASAPAPFARARMSEAMMELAWSDLQLSQNEARALVGLRAPQFHGFAEQLVSMTNGWAGGVTLLLERLRRDGSLIESGTDATASAAFDYFESQIMAPLGADTCDMLMRTGLLPFIDSALLAGLMDTAHPDEVLQSLFHRHLFIDHRPGNSPTFHLHPLFQEFLRTRAERHFDASTIAAFRTRAASILCERGHVEAGTALRLLAGQWRDAQESIVALAPALIAQGRWQTLHTWIRQLPASMAAAYPWLDYWLGRSLIAVDASAARETLERNFEAFARAGSDHGQILVAASVLEALHHEFRDLSAMDTWVERTVALLEQGITFNDAEDELRVNAAVMIGASNRMPRHGLLDRCVARVTELLERPLEANLRVSVASMLHAYGNLSGLESMEEIARRIARPLLETSGVTAATAALYLGMESHSHYVRFRYAEGLACLDRADALARQHDLRKLLPMLGNWRGLNERRAGLLDQAAATVARTEALGLPAVGQPRVVVLQVKASVAFARGEYASANSLIEEAYRLSGPIRFHTAIHSGLLLSYFAISSGEPDRATAVLADLRARASGPLAGNYAGIIALLQAWHEWRMSKPTDCAVFLREALLHSADPRQFYRFAWYENALAELLPLALRDNIESPRARALIQHYDVRPIGAVPVNWPWPVRILTLGGFSIEVRGVPLVFGRKTPRKALALLKVLTTDPAMRVREGVILDTLWPDAEGDFAQRALSATLHRLRNMLNDSAVVHQRDGYVSLDSTRCWVDATAFASFGAQGDPRSTAHALELYRGPFLKGDDEPWYLPRRHALRAVYLDLFTARGGGDATGSIASVTQK